MACPGDFSAGDFVHCLGNQREHGLVTADTQGSVLQLQRLNDVREGREDSMQLWALDGDKPPRSLGVIASPYKTLQLPAAATALAGVQELAISVEDKRGPRLPYLFKGGLVKKAL
ncbi:MAG: hypothetical protein B7Y20_11645 [Acidovorax sp. 16-64-162]|nr:MAG: hypothetical protein B7Y20_11645 [Acidovorax sp. 16-64-162]